MSRRGRPRRTILALAVGATLAAAFVLWRAGHLSGDSQSRPALRVLEARVSTDSQWAPCAVGPASETGWCRTAADRLGESSAGTVAQWADRASSRGATPVRRQYGLATLLGADSPEDVRRALHLLVTSSETGEESADLLVDLSAAQLSLAALEDDTEALAFGLGFADRALSRDAMSSRAHFNRALALQKLGLLDSALEAWRQTAIHETDDQWRGEVMERALEIESRPRLPSEEDTLAVLERAFAADCAGLPEVGRAVPQRALELSLTRLLPRWRQEVSESEVGCLEVLADEMRATTGDRLLSDLAEVLRAASSEGALERHVQELRQWGRAFAAYRARRFTEAAGLLADLRQDLATAPLDPVLAAYQGTALHAAGSRDEALGVLAEVPGSSEVLAYRWPLAIAHWTLGRMAVQQGDPLRSVEHYLEALRAFEENRSDERAGSVHILLAEAYSELGRGKLAWKHAVLALEKAYRIDDDEPLFFALNLFEPVARNMGFEGLALEAQVSALGYSDGVEAGARTNGLLWRAILETRLGRPEAARLHLAEAEALLASIEDPGEYEDLASEIELAGAELDLVNDPSTAITRLDEALAIFRARGNETSIALGLELRARAHRATGALEPARADLAEAIAIYERTLTRLPGRSASDHQSRLSYARRRSSAHGQMVELLAFDLGRPWEAFDQAERAKWTLAPGSRAPIGDRASIEPEDGAALLSYFLTSDQVIAWLVTPGGRSYQPVADRARFEALVERLDSAVDAEAWDEMATTLYSTLVGPFRDRLEGVEELRIVTTPGIDRVPFPGLRSPISGRYLVEDFTLTLQPTAGTPRVRAGRSGARGGRALVIGDPAGPASTLLGLGPLRHAREEATQVAATLGDEAMLELGAEATRSRFLATVPEAALVHFAGHAVSGGPDAASAALLLAPDLSGDLGLVSSEDILGLRLDRTELVVLSACSSAAGPVDSWQSGWTLARSFLASGAEQVIATLKAVDDEESSGLFEAFYRSFVSTGDAAAALREAQRTVIEDRRSTGGVALASWPYVVLIRV